MYSASLQIFCRDRNIYKVKIVSKPIMIKKEHGNRKQYIPRVPQRHAGHCFHRKQ